MGLFSKNTHSQFRLDRIKTPNYWILYTIFFALMLAVVYHYFILTNKVAIWIDDGRTQNYTTLVYLGVWIRDMVKNFIHNHSLNIATYSFSLGYGGDIVQLLHYYVLGDPFNIFTIFVPSSKTIHLYHFLIILRLYFAGFAFSKMCFCFNKNANKIAVLAGALAYVFCAYAMISGPRHPYFINPMIYFPMIIMGIEKIRKKETPYVFILGVFFSALSNFYFFYMIVIFTVMYVVLKFICDIKKTTFKEAVIYFLKLLIYSVLGVVMAGIIFLPVFLQFLGDPRMTTETYVEMFYESEYYKSIPRLFIAAGKSAPLWTHIGFGGLIIPSIFTLFIKRGKRLFLKIAFILIVIFMVVPYIGHLFNGISYASNRWIWVAAPLLAYIITVTAEDFATLRRRDLVKCLMAIGFYFVICAVVRYSIDANVAVQLSIAIAAIFLIFLINTTAVKHKRYVTIVALVAVMLGIAVNAYYAISPVNSEFLREYDDGSQFNENYNSNEAALIRNKYPRNEFYRYTGSSLQYNASLLNGLSSTQFYYSMSNPNLFEWFDEMNTNITMGQMYKDLDDSAILNTLANVKYFASGSKYDREHNIHNMDSEKRVPYGFDLENGKHFVFNNGVPVETLMPENRYDVEKKSFSVYKNKNFLPFGYTYSGTVSRDEYSKMSAIEKQEALLQGVVLDKDENALEKVDTEFLNKDISYTIVPRENVTYSDNKFTTTADSTVATLYLNGSLKNSETYISFKNVDFVGTSEYDLYNDDVTVDPEDKYNKEDLADLGAFETELLKNEKMDYASPTRVDIGVSGQLGNFKSFAYRDENNMYYEGRKDFMMNLDYSEKPLRSVNIFFPVRGVYSFDDLKVYCLPFKDYEKKVKALKKDVLTNVNFHEYKDSFSTNEITGDISLKENKLLMLTIPYSEGWKAYVDGKEVEILRANTAFSGIMLSKGNHKVRLKYDTPWLKLGISVSIVGVGIFVLLIITLTAIKLIKKSKSRRTRRGI